MSKEHGACHHRGFEIPRKKIGSPARACGSPRAACGFPPGRLVWRGAGAACRAEFSDPAGLLSGVGPELLELVARRGEGEGERVCCARAVVTRIGQRLPQQEGSDEEYAASMA